MSSKTRKSITKRFKITKNKKLMHRLPHQCHLNAKKTGDERRKKRQSIKLWGSMVKKIIKFKS